MRDVLVSLLRDDLEIVGISKDGRELVETALSALPDVIVSDVRMPLLTGPQAMEELYTRGYTIPFVFVSTYRGILGSRSSSLVSKTDILHELLPAVRAAASGATDISGGSLQLTPWVS
jgi:CheY-like chemotaxis protein